MRFIFYFCSEYNLATLPVEQAVRTASTIPEIKSTFSMNVIGLITEICIGVFFIIIIIFVHWPINLKLLIKYRTTAYCLFFCYVTNQIDLNDNDPAYQVAINICCVE